MFLFNGRSVTYKLTVFIPSKHIRTIVSKMAANKRQRNAKEILREMFDASVRSVLPHELIKNKIHLEDKQFYVDDKVFSLTENVYLVGFGKAVMGMAIVLEQKLHNFLKKGIISIPRGSTEKICEVFPNINQMTSTVIEYCEGSQNNQPDETSLETTQKIMKLVSTLKNEDTLIVLVSGGGSALLCKPKPGITLKEKQHFCRDLQNAGADICELNTIRKCLSEVKGGGLIQAAYPASVISLILSDIVNDPIDLIASGPTVYSYTSTETVKQILQKFNLSNSLPENIKNYLINKKNEKEYPNHDVSNIVIGNNMLALKAAEKQALKRGLCPVILKNNVTGDIQSVSQTYVNIVASICNVLEGCADESKFLEGVQMLTESKAHEVYQLVQNVGSEGIVLISGGEPTVKVTGHGKGGRNQELALRFSLDWKEKIKLALELRNYHVLFLSAGTDGQDGPTDAAGAFGYPEITFEFMYLKEKLMEVSKMVTENSDRNIDEHTFSKYKEFCKTMETEEKQYYYGKQFIDKLIQQVDKLNPENVLVNNDSYSFYSSFKKGADLIKTGITGTNVMDVHFIYIKKRQCNCYTNFTKDEISSNPFLEHDLTFKDELVKLENNVASSTQRQLPRINVIDRNLATCNCNIYMD